MITIEDFNTRFPKLNENYIGGLSEDEKKTYIKRWCRYYDKLLDIIILKTNLTKFEEAMENSECCFKAVNKDDYDLYQMLAYGKLNYVYLRNNIYIERLNDMELALLDDESKDITELVNKTFIRLINDYPEKELETNYGPDSYKFYAKSSNLILGLRIYEDYFPDNINKADLIFKRDSELYYLQQFLITIIEDDMNMDGSVIIYDKNSVKKLEKKTDEFVEEEVLRL